MKLGFICEGHTEKAIIDSINFQQFLKDRSYTWVPDIINAEGNGQLLPTNLPQFTQRLTSQGAEKIIILTDLDKDACVTVTKQRISAPADHLVFVSVKAIEAWFLADDVSMSIICSTEEFHFEHPENEVNPFETIRQLLLTHTGRSLPFKTKLAKRVLENDFSVLRAAAHPNCPSAKYFIDKLKALK